MVKKIKINKVMVNKSMFKISFKINKQIKVKLVLGNVAYVYLKMHIIGCIKCVDYEYL